MGKPQAPSNFSDFISAEMNNFFAASFPGLNKVTSYMEKTAKEEKKEKKEEDKSDEK